MSLETLVDTLEFSRESFFKECTAREGPSLSVLRQIADHFEITLDDLLDGHIDQDWVRKPELSEKFRAENGSKLRTSIAVLRWMEETHGKAVSTNLMRALRIPAATLTNPDQPVKLRLLTYLLRAASARGMPDSTIFEIGARALDIPENTFIRERLQKFNDPKQLLEFFFAEMTEKFESNYDYRPLRLTSNQIEFQVTPKENRILENGMDTITDQTLSAYRCGVSASLLRTIGVHSAKAKLLRHSSAENAMEVVRLSWEKTQATFSVPRRLRLVDTSSNEL